MTESIQTLEVEDVYPNPRHYREVKPEAVKALAANIAVVGQLEPIRVWKDGNIYYVDAGHHRLEAVKLLGFDTIDAIVQDSDNVSAMVGSNMHSPESEIEKSRGTQLLLSTGVIPHEAAALVGVDTETVDKAAAGLKAIADPVAAEDLTLDRLIAISEFADDPDKVKALENAAENEWKRIHQQYDRLRRTEAAVAEAKAIVEAAGCEVREETTGSYAFLGSGKEAPEGALYAVVSGTQWMGTAEIYWYGEASQAVDPEEQARQEAAARHQAEAQASHDRRVEFVVSELVAPDAPTNDLRDFCWLAWDAGYGASASEAHEDVTGQMARFYSSVLSAVEMWAKRTVDYPSAFYIKAHGEAVSGYFDALKASGYETVEVEDAAIQAVGERDE